MKPILRFNKKYFALAVLLFIVEVLIAKYVHDHIIRPYIGDTLVVILIYCFVRSFLDTPVVATGLCVLAFSFLIETLQYFEIVKKLGLQHSKIASVIIGTSFAWMDIYAYIAGIMLIFVIERLIGRKLF
jgi:hypothetical protein